MKRFLGRVALACGVLCLSAQLAVAGPITGKVPDQAMAADAAVAAVDESVAEAYRAMRARYAAAETTDPGDVGVMVSHCQFIESFVEYEDGRYVADAGDDLEACRERLARVAPADPRARVYLFEGQWDEEVVATGDVLLDEGAAWPRDLRRRVAAKLSRSLSGEDPGRSGELAVVAAGLGDASLLPQAVAHLARRGDTAHAVELLASVVPQDGGWMASRRIEAALTIDAPQAAIDDVRRHQTRQLEVEPALVAQAHLRAGDVAAAEAIVREAGDDAAELKGARFEVAMAARDWPAAAATIDLTDLDGFGDNFARLAKLASAAPWSLALPSLWLSLLVLAAIALALALAPGVLLLPVHYRGAIRRLRGRAPVPPFDTVGLRHAWFAAVAMLLLPMAVMALVDVDAFVRMMTEEGTPDGRTLVMVALYGSVLGLILLARPLLRLAVAGGFGWSRVGRAWWRIGLAWLGTMAVGYALAAWQQGSGADTTTAQVQMVNEMVNSGAGTWRLALAVLAVVLLVPVWEECVFRGLFLGGVARHISFGWANLLQATVFALVHDDAPRFAYYLVMGLSAGWLVRSTRSLAPAIVLHMLINGIAFLLLHR